MSTAAVVAVVVPAFRSHTTIGACLESLQKQTLAGVEVVVVDSSPDERTAAIVREQAPDVRLIRSSVRLLPHQARNLGARATSAPLLVFTDPDVVMTPTWLAELVRVHDRRGGLVCGALACHGRRWLDVGVHLCKFSTWLPGGTVRRVDNAATANLAVARSLFEELGGFPGDVFQGDTVLSWRAVAAGHALWLAPAAVVHHHHTSSFGAFMRERLRRGVLFGHLRASQRHHGAGRNLLFLAVSVLPLRLTRVLWLTFQRAARAGQLGAAFRALPLLIAGHSAFILGEAWAYANLLAGRRTPPDETSGG